MEPITITLFNEKTELREQLHVAFNVLHDQFDQCLQWVTTSFNDEELRNKIIELQKKCIVGKNATHYTEDDVKIWQDLRNQFLDVQATIGQLKSSLHRNSQITDAGIANMKKLNNEQF